MQQIKASIITIGDELLIGQVVDTNSAWLAQQLNKAGVWVQHRVAVGDVWDDIWQALDEEAKRSDIVLITGGLGPTADDITKPLLCEYFGGKMILHQETLEHVTYLFEHIFKRQMPLLERNRKQAEVPDVATVLKNDWGTAPGMMFKKEETLFFSLPGVPFEMKNLTTYRVLPYIQQHYQLPYIGHRTLLTAGIGESFLAEKIHVFETALPEFIKLAYLPNYGMVRLRLSATGNKGLVEQELNKQFEELKTQVAEFLVMDEDASFQQYIGKLLLQKGKTMATAESCTGGYIAHLITSIAGSSAYFKGSVVSYANEVKNNVLHVAEQTLNTVGAVSEQTVQEMVKGVLDVMKTDYAVAVSGIMGPDGGTEEKPAGTVWIAVGNATNIITRQLKLRFDRERNIQVTAVQALNFLRQFIVNDD